MWLILSLFLLVASAYSQDALRDAVREDAAYLSRRTASQAEPAGWKMGPVYLSPSVSFGVEYNDNVRNTENKESDFILRPGAAISGLWTATERSHISFGFGWYYSKYLENSDLDRSSISPNSELAYDLLIKNLVLSFYDNFSYSQDVISQPSLSGVANFPRYDNTIGTRATWTPGQGLFSAGYAHQNSFSTEQTNNYIDRATEQLFGRAGYRLRPETTIGVEVSAAFTDYDQESQHDNVNVSTGPYLDWKPLSALSLKFRGGYVYYHFDPTNSTDPVQPLSTYYAQVTVDHRITDHISQQFSAVHDIRPSFDQGSDYLESTTIRYSISWAFRQYTTLSAFASYESGTQPGVGGVGLIDEAEEYTRPGFGVSVSQQFTKKFTGVLGYNFYTRDSNIPGQSYDVNQVTLTLNYQF